MIGRNVDCFGSRITTAIWRFRKTFSQWEYSFQWKLRCHWLKELRQSQIIVAIQDTVVTWGVNYHSDSRQSLLMTTKWRPSWVDFIKCHKRISINVLFIYINLFWRFNTGCGAEHSDICWKPITRAIMRGFYTCPGLLCFFINKERYSSTVNIFKWVCRLPTERYTYTIAILNETALRAFIPYKLITELNEYARVQLEISYTKEAVIPVASASGSREKLFIAVTS